MNEKVRETLDDPIRLQREINEKVAAQIPSRAWDSTVPIVIAHDGAVHQFGTGTLLRIADCFFLVTAGHVIKDSCKNNKTVGIGGSDDRYFIALRGEAQVSSDCQGETNADPFDIGLYRLPPDIVARMKQKQFLLLDDIDFVEQSPTAVYTLFGFPAVWSSPDSSGLNTIGYKAFQYTAYRYDRDTSVLKQYQDRYHLLLDAQLTEATDHDGNLFSIHDADAEKILALELGGISGCSVWRVGDLKAPFNEWGIKPPQVVAVQTGVYKSHRAIKATRWIAVSTLIYEAYPELRPAMALAHPHRK